MLLLYTSNETQKMNKSDLKWLSKLKRIKYVETYLTKEVQNLCSENDKTFLKGIKKDLNKWKDNPCSWIRRFNIGKK